MINEDNTTQDIVYDDNQLFSILKLSELKGTNAVACTESIQCYYKIIYAFQDILIGGKVNNGGHNYNVVQKNGKYRIVDVGQIVSSVLPNINDSYDWIIVKQCVQTQISDNYLCSQCCYALAIFFIFINPFHIIILALNLLNDLNPKAILFITLIKLLFPSM